MEQWLFFANSTRFASAMMGADYGAFANGRWYLSKNIQEMSEWLKSKIEQARERKMNQPKKILKGKRTSTVIREGR